MKQTHPKIAIIGAGFAGLSLAWHLLSISQGECQVTIFDKEKVGSGASGVASGLLHPFPAAATRLSFKAAEAMHQAICLLQQVSKYSNKKLYDDGGILKLALEDDQKKEYGALTRAYESVAFWSSEQVGKVASLINPCPALFIQNGITVFCKDYLEALCKSIEQMGGKFEKREIQDLDSLKDYDIKIICAGSGIKVFEKNLKLQYVKGQILTCRFKEPLTQKSLIGKGYITLTEDPLVYHIGSTYEHYFKEEGPCLDMAKRLILNQWASVMSQVNECEILHCDAGIRVMNPKNYLPIIKQYQEDVYAITGFGSRGLLYHALLGKQLAEKILLNDKSRILREFFVSA